MMKQEFKFRSVAIAAALALPMTTAMATNGMLMEGYGPISTGMGGASQAIDHGNAAMAQNPATLGMMADGTSRLDVAFGILGPDVNSSMPGMPTAKSGGTSYLMPAVGYTKRSGPYTYGFGLFAQGGMGTEYDAGSLVAAMQTSPVRSELGVGNFLVPVAYQVNSDLTLGATLKFVWASLDMQMNGSIAQLANYVDPQQTNPGGLVTQMGMIAAGAPGMPPAGSTFARIDFSDGGKFSGAAKATGFGAGLGATYKANKDLMLGASYQFKTRLADMETAATSASLGFIGMGAPDVGKMTIIDFQMPSVFALGASWNASPALMVAADVKYIGWADSMKSFKMRYDSANAMMGSVNFAIDQQWKDQTVLNLGVAWKANDQLTLRAGMNLADNPIPNDYVNPLFPATVKSHYTLGLGYKFSPTDDFNMSLTMAPEVSVTGTGLTNTGITITHAQTNWQFMYSHRF
jgi:long-chain fatty acid transport protein